MIQRQQAAIIIGCGLMGCEIAAIFLLSGWSACAHVAGYGQPNRRSRFGSGTGRRSGAPQGRPKGMPKACVYRKPHPAMILVLAVKFPVLVPEFPAPPKYFPVLLRREFSLKPMNMHAYQGLKSHDAGQFKEIPCSSPC